MIKKLFLLVIFSLLISFNALAEDLTAKVNRTQVPEGETFLLTLEYSNGTSSQKPDLSVLEQDFNVFSVGNSYRTQIENGKMSQNLQWNLVLMPKKLGKIEIPSISIGDLKSNPVSINVIEPTSSYNAPKPQAQSQKPQFRMIGNVNNKTPYVQQQIDYTLKLYDAGGLQGEEPVFVDNGKNEWVIKRISEPEVITQNIDGKNIREIKFQYALFPQKSGSLEVPSVRFNGYYLSKSKRHDPFADMFGDDFAVIGFGMNDIFANKTPISLMTKPIAIDVKPIPQDFAGKWWLPASSLSMYAEFGEKTPQFEVGQAINRSIYIKAKGVIDTQLPDIKFEQIKGMKIYPSQPENKTYVEDNSIVSVKKVDVVYIPDMSGEAVLPAISLDWFNVHSNRAELASLPAVKINVKPSTIQSFAEKTPAETKIATKPSPSTNDVSMPEVQKDLTQTILIVGGAFLLGLIVSYLMFKPRKSAKKNMKKLVVQKAKARDLRGLRDALISWAENYYAPHVIKNLQDIINLTDNKDFCVQLEELNGEIYSKQDKDFNEEKFIASFEKLLKSKKSTNKKDKLLPELYK